ncbi:MAG: glycosyltransferase [Chitinivibrionales bacterium]
MKLSILICTLPQRKEKFERLFRLLLGQCTNEVQIISNEEESITIGCKRNRLIGGAKGEYVCFVDDDDLVSKNYISHILAALSMGPDCVGIQGVMLVNGNCPRRFFHTIESTGWYTSGCEYWRTPNHLNPIKRSIVKKVMFNEFSSFGEDKQFSEEIKPFLKTEVLIDDPIYYYLYNLRPCEKMFCENL